jgi:hypothetical protein
MVGHRRKGRSSPSFAGFRVFRSASADEVIDATGWESWRSAMMFPRRQLLHLALGADAEGILVWMTQWVHCAKAGVAKARAIANPNPVAPILHIPMSLLRDNHIGSATKTNGSVSPGCKSIDMRRRHRAGRLNVGQCFSSAAAGERRAGFHCFLTNFRTSPKKSAPYTLPSESAVTPSAKLDPPAYGYGHESGMKYLTEPSLALPIRMPRCAPRL